MIKSKKTKKILSRFLAVLGVVVILVSVFAVPASAWELTDIHFYNYLDLGAVPNRTANDGRQAYITSVDAENGLIEMSAIYTVNDIYYVPYQYSKLTLRDLLPEAKVGETYYLMGYYMSPSFDTDENFWMKRIHLVNSSWSSQKKWKFGEPLTLSEDDLNANVTIFFGDLGKSVTRPPENTVMNLTLRIWANKDAPYSFVSHNLLGDLAKDQIEGARDEGYQSGLADGKDAGYDEGYLDGDRDGYAEGYQDALDKMSVSGYLTYENLDSVFLNTVGTNLPNRVGFISNLNFKSYPFNGTVFSTDGYIPQYLLDPMGKAPVTGIGVSFRTLYGDTPIRLVDFKVTFNKPFTNDIDVDNVYICIKTEDDVSFEIYRLVENWGFTIGASDFKEMGVPDDAKIKYMTVYYEVDASGTSVSPDFDKLINISVLDSSGPIYNSGYRDGYDEGYGEGEEKGFLDGKREGLAEGEEKGFKDGYEKGEDKGFAEGELKGKQEEAKNTSFFKLIYAVIDAPVQVIAKTLNFEFMGVNFAALASSMVTLAILIVVVKYFV